MPALCSWPHFLRDSGTNFIKSDTNRVKIAQMGNLFSNRAENGHFLRHYDVISPDDVIFRILKCHHCVAGHISYGIGDRICIKSEPNRVNIAQMGNLFSKRGENCHFLRHYDVISPDNVILRIWKCHHCVPGHISYGIRLAICVKSAINRVTRAQICVFGCFPYISNTKCLYKGIFTKTSVSTPIPTTSETQTNIFLKLWVCTQLK